MLEKIVPIDGLRWWWTREKFYVLNKTKHVIGVKLSESGPVMGVDIGTESVFPATVIGAGCYGFTKTRLATLSYYTETRDLMSLFVWDSGSWTSKLTPMVPPSCYTNDRRETERACIRRRRGSNAWIFPQWFPVLK
jgi:hypothetical protein